MYDNFESYRAYKMQQNAIDESYAAHQNAVSDDVTESRYEAFREMYNQPVAIKASMRDKLPKFKNDVYKSFVAEAVSLIASCAVKAVKDSDSFDYNRESAILNNIANRWVNEQSMYDLQKKMNSTATMSCIDCICKKYATICMEKANAKIDKGSDDDKFVYEIEDDDKENFYDELDAVNADELVYTIRDRVSDAASDFIDSYVKDKLAIKSIMQDTKATIDDMKLDYAPSQDDSSVPSSTNDTEYNPYTANNPEDDDMGTDTAAAPTADSVKESYMNISKRKINAIMHKPVSSIYETMVINLSTAAYKNTVLAEEFVLENAKLDTDAIRTRAGVMYTWLETLNTTGLERVTPAFLKETLEEIKNM